MLLSHIAQSVVHVAPNTNKYVKKNWGWTLKILKKNKPQPKS